MGAPAIVFMKFILFVLIALFCCGICGVLARPPWTPTPGQRAEPRGYLGIDVRNMTPDDEVQSAKEARGVIVVRVRPGTAAAEAGLIEGDVIVELDGKALADAAQFSSITSDKASGTVVKLRVFRQGVEKLIQAPLGGWRR
jgi:S1-C subfamily serine protease